MKGLQIKINSQWVKLSEDFSITLEQSNPLFNDQGTFSFPFEIPLEPNREIFKNIADPWGDINLKDIDRMPAELWVDGIMIYRGVIETDDEVEFEDTLPVTFISGNSDFMDRIEGMNARDIPLDREIKLGYRVKSASTQFVWGDDDLYFTVYLSDGVMNYTESNESDPYPSKTYCNVRVCTPNNSGTYNVLRPKRPYSGVCFYVLYLLDCFFKYLGIGVNRNELLDVDDMCRLAFFSTQCHTEEKGNTFSVSYSDIISEKFMGNSFSLKYDLKYLVNPNFSNLYITIKTFYSQDFSYKGINVYATNENFPDLEMKDLIEDLQSAFGIRFLYDSAKNTMDVIYIKDILKSNEISILDVEIVDIQLKRTKEKTIRISYGKDDDTSFNYDDYSNVKEKNNYMEILQQGQASNDTTCYQDKLTGNSYRIKVDKNTGGNPSLFEVGGFRDYVIGGTSSESDEEEISLNFSPVMINDVNGSDVVSKAMVGENGEQLLAVFADQELLSDKNISIKLIPEVLGLNLYNLIRYRHDITLSYLSDENYDKESAEESPMRTYDAGFCLGIMRGPGSESGIDYSPNYDGEGNDSWVHTAANSAFTADSCDNFGRFFDYNGTEQGGVDQPGRFSLKLVAGKDKYPASQAYQDRGLVSKFLSEYLYFLYNRKTVILTVRMTISQIAGLDMLKRYQIGNYVGFINKLSYSIDRSGITEVTIELYTI